MDREECNEAVGISPSGAMADGLRDKNGHLKRLRLGLGWLRIYSGTTLAGFGGVAGFAAIYFLSDVPRFRRDIMQVCWTSAHWDGRLLTWIAENPIYRRSIHTRGSSFWQCTFNIFVLHTSLVKKRQRYGTETVMSIGIHHIGLGSNRKSLEHKCAFAKVSTSQWWSPSRIIPPLPLVFFMIFKC